MASGLRILLKNFEMLRMNYSNVVKIIENSFKKKRKML